MSYPSYLHNYPLPSWNWHRPHSQKDRQEQKWILKRELDNVRQEYWQGVARYFYKTDLKACKYSEWESQMQQSDSVQLWRSEQEKKKRLEKLEERREKLAKLIQSEKLQYEKELKLLKSSKKRPEVWEWRTKARDLQERREEKRRAETEKLLYNHWKHLQPQLREQESRQYGKHLTKAWEEQVEEKRKQEEQRKIEAEAYQKAIEEERKKSEQLEVQEEQERKRKLDEWKEKLNEQADTLRKREEEIRKLEKEELQYTRQRDEILLAEDRRKALLNKRNCQRLSTFWSRQHRLKLVQKAKEIQESLEEDRKMLSELLKKQVGDSEKILEEKAQARIQLENMHRVLKEQNELEKRREREFHFLFQEEAEEMWRRLERQWQREQAARERLMADVMQGLQQQVQDKLRLNQQKKERVTEERKEIQHSLKNTQAQIKNTQAQIEKEKERWRTDLDAQVAEKMKQKEEQTEKEKLDALKRKEQIENEERCLEEEIRRLEIENFMPRNYGRKRRLVW